VHKLLHSFTKILLNIIWLFITIKFIDQNRLQIHTAVGHKIDCSLARYIVSTLIIYNKNVYQSILVLSS